jgi:hypothetical protein
MRSKLTFTTGTLLQIQSLKKDLRDPNAPFGVDLLLPQVGGGARKTNVRHLVQPLASTHLQRAKHC